ncbi:MAG: 1-phosphofructokinase family hexose kinase [Clostridia bacterium]|nr:1-phosphofructokinase family hexose kinase [Clostridia bacterium]
MILTVCLSPCIDVNIEVDSLAVGKSHKVISKRIFFTGKALNVAIGLAHLKSDVFATGFMYEGNGNQFEIELHREGVPYKFVWNEGRVRENYKFIDMKSMLTEIDDVSPEVSEKNSEELISLVKQLSQQCEAVVVSGSLARGMTPDYYARILNAVPSHVKKIVDTQEERLKEALKCGVDLVKPNLEELERTLKRKIKSKEELLAGCNELLNKGAKRVLLSLGKQGAVITDGNKIYYCKSVNVAMNSTVGAGDGMVAAATNALVKGGDLKEILRCGVAAGTAAVTSPHSISFSKEKYEEILSALTVKEI